MARLGGGGGWGWDGKVTENISHKLVRCQGCFKMTKGDNCKIFCYNLIFIHFYTPAKPSATHAIQLQFICY